MRIAFLAVSFATHLSATREVWLMAVQTRRLEKGGLYWLSSIHWDRDLNVVTGGATAGLRWQRDADRFSVIVPVIP